MDDIKNILKITKQEHLLTFYSELNEDGKTNLINDISSTDWEEIKLIQKQFTDNDGKFILKAKEQFKEESLSPLNTDSVIQARDSLSKEQINQYLQTGLEKIRKGEVAALVLAGGQGTRLGSDNPKGMLDVGLKSHQSLFQIQADRLISIAKETNSCPPLWYIMTSPATHIKTLQFFIENNFFGLDKHRVILFQQDTLPSFDFDGKIFLETRQKISRSPSGNGSLFAAMHKTGIVNHLKSNNVRFIHVYCVDNILVRVCDPVFIGYCIAKNAEAGSKVVEKVNPSESVGVICKANNKFKVIEYSEIPETIASKRNKSSGKLLYNAGNICEQFFTLGFLDLINQNIGLPYHLAIKKIPHIKLLDGIQVKPTEPNGVKFEKFIFDFLEFTDRFVAWQVNRQDEFSPIKNPTNTFKDSPDTAKADFERVYNNRRHIYWKLLE